jgi:exo-1,4-beta-D-glucosaminidase
MRRPLRRIALVAIGTISLAASGIVGLAPPPGAVAATSDSIGTSDLTSGWKVQSSAVATDSGALISDPSYSTAGWLPISKPETLMAAMVENGRYPNIFYSNNLASVPTDQFDVNWWYRDQLQLHPREGQHTFLIMNGVLSRANLWVNGTKVADQSQLQGAYSRLEYDITSQVRDGDNAVALDVYKNDSSNSTGYLTLDMVDWNPPSPDNWTGLQFAPQLAQDGAISVRNAHVVQDNAPDLSSSSITVKADLRNNTDTAQVTEFSGSITHDGAGIRFGRHVTVPANSTQTVTVTPADDPGLHIGHPAVWWPYQMGGQPLYHLAVSARVRGAMSDQYSEDFGIRTVTSRLTPAVSGQTYGPSGYRQFLINGQPFVVRGGGWSQDLFLRYSRQNVHDQLAYIKNMGLNAIRFEGNLPPDDMFQQMDREGVLAMPGWQCCNKWEQRSSRWSDQIKANAANQALHVAQSLRNHPSVFTFFQGSDNEPDAAKEAIYLSAFGAADWQTPQVASAEYKASAQLGPSGAKEGPYNYAPPSYWWDSGPEMNEGGDFTNAGGAFAYDTETSPGNTIPTQDSLNRFLTAADQAQIFDPATTDGLGSGADIFHTSPYGDYTAIGRMGQYNTPLWNRYGHWSDMPSYQREAQAGGYEVTRAEFEAYIGHSKDAANPSTGLIYWQMNKAWPSLQWELYGYDFDQAGVFFGAKKANEPLHILYAYDDGSIKVANLTNQRQGGLRATAEFIDLDGSVKSAAKAEVPNLDSQGVATVLDPAVPGGISTTYFLKLTLTRGGQTISRNVYWLSTKPDSIDFANTIGSGSGATFNPNGYADLTGLQALAPASLHVTASTHRSGREDVTKVTVSNDGTQPVPSFLTRADVRRATAGGTPLGGDDQVLPILWSDNDVTLWPGESQTLTARYRHEDLHGATPVVEVSGWNLSSQVVAAP